MATSPLTSPPLTGAANGDASAPVTAATGPSSTKPDKRQQNPLGNFASYTYQLTLYMISPDAYNAFILSGRKKLETSVAGGGSVGAVVVAQSGGINNAENQRAAGFELDYYIDDLKIKTATNAKNTQTASNTTSVTFNIFEPYGFSFITNLKKAADQLKASSKIKNYASLENASKQFFILGIRFQGYDATGKAVTAADVWAPDTFNPKAQGVFERFYDLILTSIKFKIDGKSTQYNITAASIRPQVSQGTLHGRIPNGATVVASSVAEALGGADVPAPEGVRGLLDTLNKTQQDLLKPVKIENREGTSKIEIANEYRIRWLGTTAADISNATIVSPADTAKSKYPMSTATNTSKSNATLEVTASPDNSKRTLTFKNDTSIMQAISTVILKSSFLENAMKVVAQSSETSNSISPGEDGSEQNGGTNPIKWYNLSADVEILGWDRKVSDFAYRITYVIQPYETPAAISVYGNDPTQYYGAHKKYNYWYTGLNSEILKYEQSLDNSYFNVALSPTGDPASQGGNANITTAPNQQVAGNNQGSQGEGAQAQNSYVANLYDPGSYTNVKVQILGDPDFLMYESPGTVNDVYDQYYGADGYSVNPNGGQVFIEIDFREGKDYAKADGSIDGLMDINSSILFWNYPPGLAKAYDLHGVSYMVLSVASTFSKGTFTQDIEATINTFPKWKDPAKVAADAAAATAAAATARSNFAATDPRLIGAQADTPTPAGVTSNPMGDVGVGVVEN